MNKSRIRILFVNLLVLAIAGGVGYWGWSALHPAPPATVSQTTTASVADVQSTVSASGTVLSPGDVGVSPSVSEPITAIDVKVGQHVTAGTLMATLNSVTLLDALNQAKATLATQQITFASDKQAIVNAQLNVSIAQNAVTQQQQTNAINAQTYQATVDNAKAKLVNDQTTAQQNVPVYASSVSSAKDTLDNATTSYNNSLITQTQKLAADQATITSDQSALVTAQAKLATDKSTADQNVPVYASAVTTAKQALDTANLNYNNYEGLYGPAGVTLAFCNSINTENSNCTTLISDWNTVQSATVTYNNALITQTQKLAADQQTLTSDQTAIDTAHTKLVNDQTTAQQNVPIYAATVATAKQSLNSATTAYNNSLVTQSQKLAADQQTQATDQASITSAQNSQTLSLAKDAASLVSAQNSVTTAQNSVTSAQNALKSFQAQNGIDSDTPTATDFQVAQSAIAVAQNNYNQTFVKAPVTGDVASISAVVGQVAPTSTSSTLGSVSGFIVLTNVAGLEVSAGFSESDEAKIQPGQEVTYSFTALPSANATGKVISVNLLPVTGQSATTYTAYFSIDGTVPGLKPGMSGTVQVLVNDAPNALSLNPQAVTTFGSSTGATTRGTVNVVTTKNGKQVLTPTPVVVGLVGDSLDQIISGIKAGTVVAIKSSSTALGSNGFPATGVPAIALAGGGGFGGGGGGRGGGFGG